jgi:uncharacterized protein with PQ loop repeat
MPKKSKASINHTRSRHVYQGKFIDRAIYVAAFVEPLSTVPQVIAIFSTRSAAGISISTWITYVAFSFLWLWYGIVHKQKALIVAEVLFILTEGLVVIGGIVYGAHW